MQGDDRAVDSPALPPPGAGVINEDHPHQTRGEGQKVLPVGEGSFALRHQLHIQLVNKGGGLQSVSGPFGAEIRFGNGP